MKREDIIKLANDMAFFASIWIDEDSNEINDLVKFAKLVDAKATAKEREACAAIVGDMPIQYEQDGKYCMTLPEDYEAAIRARGNT
jgi:hypothetical protein